MAIEGGFEDVELAEKAAGERDADQREQEDGEQGGGDFEGLTKLTCKELQSAHERLPDQIRWAWFLWCFCTNGTRSKQSGWAASYEQFNALVQDAGRRSPIREGGRRRRLYVCGERAARSVNN